MVSAPRPRPAYRALSIRCRNCGAAVSIGDERTAMRVCDYCQATLALNGTEQAVLSLGAPSTVAYRLALRQRLKIGGASYEVIARVCFIEDGDATEQTHEYYLYHPRRAPLWLSDYRGTFSISWRTRLRPRTSPFGASRVETFDGRTWRYAESGTYEVFHVDGALPFVLRVGDHIEYAELRRGAELYEVQRTAGEIEYALGRYVEQGEMDAWLGEPLGDAPRSATRASRAPVLGTVLLGAVATLTFFALIVSVPMCDSSGELLARFEIEPERLAGEFLTDSFTIEHDDTIVRVQLSAPLRNAWMSAQLALVADDGDTVLHVDDAELQYYEGIEEGEYWAEGSGSANVYFVVSRAGRYRLLLGGVSGFGEASSSVPQHPLSARVYGDAACPEPLLLAVGVVVVLGLLFGIPTVVASRLRRARAEAVIGIVGALLIVIVGALAAVAAFHTAPELEHPEGLSIRQASVGAGQPSFFLFYDSPRRHLGGGVHAGK